MKFKNQFNQQYFIDMWGYKVNWNDKNKGWTDARKINMLHLK